MTDAQEYLLGWKFAARTIAEAKWRGFDRVAYMNHARRLIESNRAPFWLAYADAVLVAFGA